MGRRAERHDRHDPELNLNYLNKAIKWSADNGLPIYGLAGDYRIKPTANDPCLRLRPNARVYCAPGCIISWDTAPMAPGMVYYAAGSANAHLTGIELKAVASGGVFPAGDVCALKGDDILIDHVLVTDHRAGTAFVVNGNRVRLANPRVKSANASAGGVRFMGGSGFRCLDGVVDVTGDAVLISPSVLGDGEILDCAVSGTSLKSSGGALVAIETSFTAITNVRVGGIVGTTGSAASAIRIINPARATNPAAISDVEFRNVDLTCGAGTADVVSIVNNLSGLPNAVTNIGFVDLSIINATGGTAVARTAFRVSGTGTDVTFVSWDGGGVRGGNYSGTCISLQRLTGGVFDGLRLDAGTTGPVVHVGNGAPCASIVISDTAIAGVLKQQRGVLFDQATSSGLVGGAVTGASSATVAADNAVAVAITAQAHGCYVEQANLAGIGNDLLVLKVDVSAATDYRLTANYGSAQQTTTVGAQVEVKIAGTATSITAAASFVKVTLTSGTSAMLTSISAGRDGDLLVLGTRL